MVWQPLLTVANNAGTSLEIAIVMIAFFCGIVFYAKGFQLGTLVNFIIYAGIFMWFYSSGLNYNIPLVMLFIYLVMLALSLFPTSTEPQSVT